LFFYLLIIFTFLFRGNKFELQSNNGKTANPVFPYSAITKTSASKTFTTCLGIKTYYEIEFSIYNDTFKLNNKTYYKFKFNYSSDFDGYIRKDGSKIYFLDKNYKLGENGSNPLIKPNEQLLFDFNNVDSDRIVYDVGILSNASITLTNKYFDKRNNDTIYYFNITDRTGMSDH
jgi:hypothetical protein